MADLARQTHDILRVNGDRWQALATLDPELLRRRPAPEEWSAIECLGHALDGESLVFAGRIRSILAGEPELRPFDPDVDSTPVTDVTDPVALADQLSTLRALSLETVSSITEADLDRTSRHLELGVVALRELLNEWAAHDLMHIVQAERALMQPFIPGSGPWRFYFVDHEAAGEAADAVDAPA